MTHVWQPYWSRRFPGLRTVIRAIWLDLRIGSGDAADTDLADAVLSLEKAAERC
jgi:hypothetical protein